MSNLAAALVTVGDFAPARELTQDALALLAQFNNPQIALYTRANLVEAQLGLGESAAALATVEALLADLDSTPRRAPQNHYLAIAAEAYALHGRTEEAKRCAQGAADIHADYPGAFNEVHAAWATAMAAQARGSEDVASLLEDAARIADQKGYLPVVCKARARLAALHARAREWRRAYEHSQRLLAAEQRRLLHRASARYYLLRVEHELASTHAERDRAIEQRVNDRYGHPAGDRVLREIGMLLGAALRPADIVCRYGGEELCVVLPDTDTAGARKALGALAARLRELGVGWNGETLRGFTFSADVAELPRDATGFAALLAAADRALYEAKAAGRDRIVEARGG